MLKKPYKGYLEIKKPNSKKCYYCKKKNCDWKRDYSIHDIELLAGSELLQAGYHKICVFKEGHYGIHPDKWNEWRKENKIAVKKALERDNHSCQMCFGEAQKQRISNLENEIRDKTKRRWKERLSYRKTLLANTKKNKLYVHHIKKVKNGGSNQLGNLITVCRYCHDIIERHVDNEKGIISRGGKQSDVIAYRNKVHQRVGISSELFEEIKKKYSKLITK